MPRGQEGTAELKDAVLDHLVDAADETDLGVAAEEAHGGAGNVRDGVGRVGGHLAGVEHDLVHRREDVRGDVVAHLEVIGVDAFFGDGRADPVGRAFGDGFIGVEGEDPVGFEGVDDGVAGLGVVVGPGHGKDGGAELVGDGDGLVGGAGVGDGDGIDDALDAGEAVAQCLRAVLHNHGKTEGRHLASHLSGSKNSVQEEGSTLAANR